MRDLRLYIYETGGLVKSGKSKSKINNSQRHLFEDIEQMKHHINWLKEKSKVWRQYIIVEYFGKYDSKILEII